MTDGLDRRHALAVHLALAAGALAARMRHALGAPEAKSPIDFCTEADRAVERLIRERITGGLGDAVIGEEAGGEAGESVWGVDPIDGTTNYIHGAAHWCVSMAYVRAGRVELGVTYAPASDRLFVARRGAGARFNGRPLRVSPLRHGAAPMVEAGWSERRGIGEYGRILHGLVERGMEFRRHGSGALALAEVAAGLSDGYVEPHVNAWDALAGLLLVQEAGGRVNDYLADSGLTRGNPVLAATPEIASGLAEMLGMTLLADGVGEEA